VVSGDERPRDCATTAAVPRERSVRFAVSRARARTSRAPARTVSLSHTAARRFDVSGRRVRLRLSSTSDASWVTSFCFDTLALTAIHGCP